MKKCVEPLQKQTMGVAFFNKIFSYWLLPYRQKKYFHVHGKWHEIGLWQIFQLSIFVLSDEIYHYLGQGPNFRFIFFVFVLLPLLGNFEVRNTNFCFFFFSCHNSRKSRHATLDWERSSLCHSFINLTQLIGDIKHM